MCAEDNAVTWKEPWHGRQRPGYACRERDCGRRSHSIVAESLGIISSAFRDHCFMLPYHGSLCCRLPLCRSCRSNPCCEVVVAALLLMPLFLSLLPTTPLRCFALPGVALALTLRARVVVELFANHPHKVHRKRIVAPCPGAVAIALYSGQAC